MQVSQIFPFSLLAVFGDPHPRGFEMRGDEERWWHGRDSQGRACMFPREQGTVRRVGWKKPSGRRLTTERKKVRNAQSLEKVDLEDETGFRIATREGACSWEVQHSAKSLLNLSCWSKPWPHQLVQNWITWQQLFCPSARGSQLGEEHILEPECKWGIRNYDQEEWREQSGSGNQAQPRDTCCAAVACLSPDRMGLTILGQGQRQHRTECRSQLASFSQQSMIPFLRGEVQERGCKREKRQSTVYINERIWYWEKIFCVAAAHELLSALWLQDFGVSDEALELS